MSFCQTCKHWEPLLDGEEWGVRSAADAPPEAKALLESRSEDYWNMPTKIPDWYYWGECRLADLNEYDEVPTPSENWLTLRKPRSLALAYDGSDYMAGLRTRCNFGCVQYEKESGI